MAGPLPRPDGAGERAIAPWLPVPDLKSDIAPAVYVNWLVRAGNLQRRLPAPLVLQTVGPDAKYGVFTVVAFRHGNFGPRFLGPLRRLAPSPIQGNWRTYVKNLGTGRTGVHFLTTTIDQRLYRLAAKLTADDVPMQATTCAISADDGTHVVIDGGTSSPTLKGDWMPSNATADGPWSHAFPSWQAMLEFVVPQDRALSVRDGRVTRIELGLDIPLDSVQPLAGVVTCPFADALPVEGAPWSFFVPRVGLHYKRQRWDT